MTHETEFGLKKFLIIYILLIRIFKNIIKIIYRMLTKNLLIIHK